MMNAAEQSAELARRFEAQVEEADPPMEGDLWDLDRLQQHGLFLAENSGGAEGARRVDLKKILRGNSRALTSAYRAVVSALQAGRAITPAAQWIADNYHVISDQFGDAPLRLTPAVWRRLPAAGHPDAPGWPRVYHIATEYLRHALWEFKPESLIRLLNAYQEIAPLRMEEIWALYPVTRIALLDELRRVAFRVEISLAARRAADELADALARADRKDRPPGTLGLPAWSYRRFSPPFVVQLAHRLQGMGERGRPWFDALSRELERRGTSIDEYIQRQHTRRSSSNVAARNIITSLRVLSSIDWRSLFEKSSRVEALLREQPDYLACDRRTRDRYRGSVEDIARATGRHEVEVTRQILALLAARPGNEAQGASLGAWLIGPLRPGLERALHYPVSLSHRLKRGAIHHAHGLYLGGVAVLTLLLTGVAVWLGLGGSTIPAGMLVLLCLFAAFPASELAIGMLNRLWLTVFPPRHLPCLALEHGLTTDMKTLVVMPTILRSERDATAACRQLQIHALANPDPLICFALLSDWGDSASESRPEDEHILAAARRGIAALNDEAAQVDGEPKFFLLHRRRQWVGTERCYTGWDRKRGKLEELNRLLLGHGPTSFLPDSAGVLRVPRGIRHVFTVDADTRLPLGCVRDLVGTAMHPLNRPVISPTERRVVQGYGVLQPRITPLLPEISERSLYREIHTSASGVDPYAAAVSDLHQDLFGEGLFTGKGLYNLAAWETVLAHRLPAESVLSHDLLEGLFARCGLVSQVELFEDFPSHSEVAAARSHRWMRGDWQLLPWILGLRGALPPLGRWKMLDNLRRSLIAPCSVALLVAAFAAGTAAWPWLALVLLPAVWPAASAAVQRLFQTPAARSRRMHLYRLGVDLAADLGRAAVSLALLAQNAWLSLDAIGRALFRLAVSRRHLLEWTTAAQLKAGRSGALSSFVWPLKSASIVVVAAAAVLVTVNPPAMARFAPLLLLWWLSPVVAQLLSRPLGLRAAEIELPQDVDAELRVTARRTWTFFEEFVTAEDNHLPPDNFQEDPVGVIAHRSSPTNFGLYLLATVAARDFGWLGLQDMLARLGATMGTLQKLERHQGHFLNWYETRTLAPLAPRYVSTVDSGNLAGHLLTLRQASLAFMNSPLLSVRALTGPLDAINCCFDAVVQLPAPDAGSMRRRENLVGALGLVRSRLGGSAGTLAEAREALQAAADDISRLLQDPVAWLPPEVARWLRAALRDIESQLRDLRVLPESLLAVLPRAVTLQQLGPCSAQCVGLCGSLAQLARQCEALVDEMSFAFLFDRARGLFSIGYRLADQALDEGYYDLLASEARLASLVAISRGDVPRSHWMRLGRRLTGGSRRPVLASWSGSMFEYLMPALVVHEPRYSLLEQTNRRVVRKQIQHGEAHHLPWGVSESAYNVRDREYTYQYSGFGVPSLGLKRGLASNYVVAPYATALAAMYRPVDANANFRVLAQLSGRGTYGFYEALDFTPTRLPEGRAVAVVRAYMAHHQGMSLVALDNVLQERIMQARFHAEPCVAAADLLLQERRIRFAEAPVMAEVDVPASAAVEEQPDVARIIDGACAPTPVTHLLSNRSYSVMLTDSGGGYSSCRTRAVTRWREDATRDHWGSFIYLRDTGERRLWSAGLQPTGTSPDEYRVRFNEECVSFERRDGALRTSMSVVVPPEDDGELRRITLCNDGSEPRQVELTSYAEVVLAAQRADVAHPGFSNLFVQTEFNEACGVLLAARRPRSSREAPVWAMHMISGPGLEPEWLQYETDRARFIGRGRDLRRPLAMEAGRALSNTVGNVLDPVFSLRTRVTVPAHGHVSVTFGTFVAATREQALALATKYRPPGLFEHVLSSAWTFARAELYYLRSSLGEAMLFQMLASHLLLGTQQLRAAGHASGPPALDVTHLWRFSISGDRPILLVRCHSQDELLLVQQCLRAQEYLRIKHLAVDVVILNERKHSYVRDLQEAIEHTVRAFAGSPVEEGDRGGIHALAAEAVGESEKRLLLSLARVVLDAAQGGLLELLSRPAVTPSPPFAPRVREGRLALPAPDSDGEQEPDLAFFNGWGGFARDTGEYVISLPRSGSTPAPWSNVIANEVFGSLVTERGSMCTWSLNSRENQLTPWSNDAVGDPSGECFYLLSEDGELWSPAAQPVRRADALYEIRHGQGYSVFEVSCRGVDTQLTVFVAASDPVKVCRLRIRNRLATPQRLLVASFVEWALGATRAGINHNVHTWTDRATGALFAGNPALIDFGTRVAFCDFGGRQQHCTDSRHQFLGRNGTPVSPAGLRSVSEWSTGHGPGNDPCGAFALALELPSQASEELLFVIGQAGDTARAAELVRKYRGLDIAQTQQQAQQRWQRMLDTVQIRTPDAALDLLFNRWLLYQVASCRFWGRAAFYQAGGAYGFRDQLQDGMALVLAEPGQVRAHLLRAAARQFPEGDVQHWWHPPSGRGVRTHMSDDLIWLPYTVHHYLQVTRDEQVLDEQVPFIEGPPLPPQQEDAHYVPGVSSATASLYEHCARTLDHSLATGDHGLPLIGGGDWNDGMNRVGHAGRGESVWLAWFLIATLQRFTPIAQARGEHERAARWKEHTARLTAACEREAWDGLWYCRAFFDDGTPLGSSRNVECRIDSIAQSWAVLSGAGDPERARAAMDAVRQHLVRDQDGLVLLFTPPFDTAPVDPGYIKGYLPGLRENGGQYTHAAIWVLMAQAMLGNTQQVGALLRMLNPVRRSDSSESAQMYRVEPYVLAADIYSCEGVARRGGWTWYTGAAGWMYRAILESVLGLRIDGDTLRVAPCVPAEWPHFEVRLALPGIDYLVRMRREAAANLLFDGSPVAGDAVPLLRDHRPHVVELILPQA